jgi:hypothetical protein
MSPSPVCAPTVGWTRHRRVASVASLHVRSHRRGGKHRLRRGLNADADPQEVRRLGPDHTSTSGGRVLPARPADPPLVDPRPMVTCEGIQVSAKTLLILLSSSSIPASDLHASPALVPMSG